MATEYLTPEPMTREEAKRILRRLELDAYSAVVTAFRAQGDMNKSKKSILGELSNQLSISTERHRAEVRRVVNDDRLNDVAECMHGPGTSTEWGIEGCRLVSLMPRLVPQTVFTAKATAAANQAAENNQKLPIKSEIEVLPLPTKVKGLPPKSNHSDSKDDKSNAKSLLMNDSKHDDKLKKKKKSNILYTKPSPLALNKSLSNPFKASSTSSAPTSLKSMGKNTPLKYSTNTVTAKTTTIPLSSVSGAGYPQKPIILQRSPSKGATGNTVRPQSTVSIQSASSSLNTNSPLASLSSSTTSKIGESPSLAQPMIKVVSNSQNVPVSVTGIGVNTANASITQKIKFKTPLPKPKVKATKFKPLVPLQRSNILSSQSYGDSIVLGSTSATVTVTSTSPQKSVTPSQGMSVKVVQVTKSSNVSSSTSLMNTLNKPVVVVSNGTSLKTPQKLTFSGVPSSVTQQLKVISSTTASTSLTQALPKGTLTSKSMPLATGFKMIAVTTVVPGTTQVKTVYIATPIMSLPKTVSQSSNSSITTAAPQNIRHISSSLASNLQSVVARSINTNNNKSTNIQQQQQQPQQTSQPSSTMVTSISITKNNKLVTQPKGLGSLKTTLAGTAQSLKLFTAVTKSRTPQTMTNVSKGTPLLPSTSMLTSASNNTQVNNQRLINSNPTSKISLDGAATNIRLRNDKPDSNGTFLNINTAGLNTVPQIGNGPVHSKDNLGPITVTANTLEEVNATLNLLNDENNMTTEQITATATGETDDMAFLNAGEKFLEQLSAKMTATSPDSLSKTDTFLFPSNLSLDMAEQNQPVFDVNEYDLSAAGNNVPSSIVIQNGIGAAKPAPALLAKDSSNFFLSHKTGAISSPKLLNNILPTGAKVLQPNSNSLSIGTFSQNSIGHHQSPVMVTPVFQQNKNELSNNVHQPPTILNYTNITNVSNKNEKDLSKVSFITVGGAISGANSGQPSSSIVIDSSGVVGGSPVNKRLTSSLKMNTPQTANKLPMSIPGSSKLNISPILNNMSGPLTVDGSMKNLSTTDVFQEQLKTQNVVNNIQFYLSPTSAQQQDGVGGCSSSVGNLVDDVRLNNNESNALTPQSDRKRKFGDMQPPPARSPVSWVRSAANLLGRVSKFRGINKQKGDLNAASWFIKAVDPSEEPGYYGIIKTPMDFTKIKRKLEDGEYESYTQFYDDMSLIKKNCYTYNPANHIARRDCDDVFNFFEGEYKKLLERWEKHHVSPQKRQRLEENGS